VPVPVSEVSIKSKYWHAVAASEGSPTETSLCGIAFWKGNTVSHESRDRLLGLPSNENKISYSDQDRVEY
jgi:hypothetical protein